MHQEKLKEDKKKKKKKKKKHRKSSSDSDDEEKKHEKLKKVLYEVRAMTVFFICRDLNKLSSPVSKLILKIPSLGDLLRSPCIRPRMQMEIFFVLVLPASQNV